MESSVETFLNLIYNTPIDERENKVKENLYLIECLSDLILPVNKSYFRIGAETIRLIGKEKFEPYIDKMLVWLQDVNWPGADEIVDIISGMNKKMVVASIERTLKIAKESKDYDWIFGIKILCKKMSISEEDFDEVNTYKILELADY